MLVAGGAALVYAPLGRSGYALRTRGLVFSGFLKLLWFLLQREFREREGDEQGPHPYLFRKDATMSQTSTAQAVATAAYGEGLRPFFPGLVPIRDPRLLVIEEDLDLKVVLERVASFLDPNFIVDWCTNVRTAREALRHTTYDLVLADYLLDGSGFGIHLLRDCQAQQPYAKFAMMSAYPLAGCVDALAHQHVPFLRKPFSVTECRNFLAAALQ